MGSLMSRTSLELMQKGSIIEVQPWFNQKQLKVFKRKSMVQREPIMIPGFKSWFQKISKKKKAKPMKKAQHLHNEHTNKNCKGNCNDYEERLTCSDLEYDWTSNSESRKEHTTFTVSMPNLSAPINHKPTKHSLFFLVKKQGDQYHIETGNCPNTQQWYANVLSVVPTSENNETLKKSTSMPVLQVPDNSLMESFSNDPSYPVTCSSEESWCTAVGNIKLHASTNARNSPNRTNVFFMVRERHGCLVIAAVECSNVHRWFAKKFHRLPDASESSDTLYQIPSIRDEMWNN